MLHNLPKYAGDFNDLIAEMCNPSTKAIAKALGVSTRTVDRWKKDGAPRIALLSLWWVSHQGHSVCDAEMANRTMLTAQTNRILWTAIGELKTEVKRAELGLTKPGKLLRSANDEHFPEVRPGRCTPLFPSGVPFRGPRVRHPLNRR